MTDRVVVREVTPTRVVVRETPTVVVRSAPGPQGPPDLAASANVAAHISANPAHDADHIAFAPAGSITATRVQGAIEEVTAAGDFGYVWSQAVAAATWGPIPHMAGRRTAVYVLESTGDQVEPTRSDPDNDTTTLDFDGAALSGTAIFT